MRVKYSTQPVYYPLSPPINYRFVVHIAVVSKSSGSTSDVSHHNENSPASTDSDCYLFHSYLACPPPAWKDDLPPKERRREPLQLQQPSVSRPAAA